MCIKVIGYRHDYSYYEQEEDDYRGREVVDEHGREEHWQEPPQKHVKIKLQPLHIPAPMPPKVFTKHVHHYYLPLPEEDDKFIQPTTPKPEVKVIKKLIPLPLPIPVK